MTLVNQKLYDYFQPPCALIHAQHGRIDRLPNRKGMRLLWVPRACLTTAVILAFDAVTDITGILQRDRRP